MNRLADFVKVLPAIGAVSAIAPFPLALLLMVLGIGFVEVVLFYVFVFYVTSISISILAWRGVAIRFVKRR